MPKLEREAPWTTSRCKRLLRPIQSRLAIIRKAARNKEIAQHDRTVAATVPNQEHEVPPDSPGPVARTPAKLKDPDWIEAPERGRRVKRFKRSHAGRGPGSQKDDFFSGEVTLPTPYRSRHTAFIGDGQSTHESLGSVMVSPGRRSEIEVPKQKKLKYRSVSDTEKVFVSLLEAFEKALAATTSLAEIKGGTRRSLYATCLRQVPMFIRHEQKRLKRDEPSDEDIADVVEDEVYAELEPFGTSGQGFRSLRSVVRAHALYLVQEALEEDVIPSTYQHDLIDICAGLLRKAHMTLPEAQGLVSAMCTGLRRRQHSHCSFASTSIWPLVDLVPGQEAVIILDRWTTQNPCYEFLYAELRKLLEAGTITPYLMLKRDKLHIWRRLLWSLSHPQADSHSCNEASRLLAAVICHTSQSSPYPETGVNQEGLTGHSAIARTERAVELLNTTVNSLAVSLTATALTNSPISPGNSMSMRSDKARGALQLIALDALERLDDWGGTSDPRPSRLHAKNSDEQLAVPIWIGATLGCYMQGPIGIGLSRRLIRVLSLRCLDGLSRASRPTTDFLAAIANHHSLDTDQSRLQEFFEISARLLDRMENAEVCTKDVLRQTIHSSARCIVREDGLRSSDNDTAAIAAIKRRMEAWLPQNELAGYYQNHLPSHFRQRFRWDDFLDEWVAITPKAAPARRKRQRSSWTTSGQNLSEDELGSGCESVRVSGHDEVAVSTERQLFYETMSHEGDRGSSRAELTSDSEASNSDSQASDNGVSHRQFIARKSATQRLGLQRSRMRATTLSLLTARRVKTDERRHRDARCAVDDSPPASSESGRLYGRGVHSSPELRASGEDEETSEADELSFTQMPHVTDGPPRFARPKAWKRMVSGGTAWRRSSVSDSADELEL